jgi:glutamate racemase
MPSHSSPDNCDHRQRPIGVFDSGLGGLTVLAALQQRLPEENFLYFADTRYLPYGDRSELFLRQRGQAIVDELVKRGAKAIVIACNTATAVAAESIRANCSLPIVALEPAVKPAAALSKNGVVGVLATTRTLESQRFERLVQGHAGHIQVIPQACPDLADAIEMDGPESTRVNTLLDQYLQPLVKAGVDVVVLGCTHYPWVRKGIASRLPSNVRIVDTGDAVARQLERVLQKFQLLSEPTSGKSESRVVIGTSGDAVLIHAAMEKLGEASISVEEWSF